ncbi:MAG: DUF3349 domain-containing protein [Micrococcales bacterium]|nr:DUF3349 domain-containing protein [Micrococcales bacterium]
MDTPGVHFVTRALHWLRGGYPEGIPQDDYVAVLGILHRSLTPTEIDSIVDDLALQAEQGQRITGLQIREMIRTRVHEHASEDDVRRVTVRLVQGGWPLAGELRKEYGLTDGPAPYPRAGRPGDPEPPQAPAAVSGDAAEDDSDEPPAEGTILGRIVAWLREGYPQGVPENDYVPLLAILQRRLTKSEVKKVAKALRREGVSPAGPDDIAAAISEFTAVDASPSDVHRVRARLAKKGWPVEFPDPGDDV